MATNAKYIEVAYDLFARTGPFEVADLVESFAERAPTLIGFRIIVECLTMIDSGELDADLHARAVEWRSTPGSAAAASPRARACAGRGASGASQGS